MANEWNFSDGFPSIEIDTDYWKSLTPQDRLRYVGKLLFQEKDLGNRLNMMNYIMTNGAKVGRAFVKNPEISAYFDIMENATNLFGISAAIGNIFKAKQKFKNTKNNEIAKLMGFPNGDYVDESKLEITHSMAEAFIEMSDYHKSKYNISIDNVITNDKEEGGAPKDPDAMPVVKKIKVVGTFGEDKTKWGLILKTTSGIFEDEDTTASTSCKFYHPVTGMKMHPDELKEEIQKVMYELYIEKVDTRKNFITINGTKIDIAERVEISENITNVDIPRICRAIDKVMAEKSRRGIVLVGEPGVGKTISVHKIINSFRKNLVFWVSSDSINSTMGIRNVFKIFKMFPNSIVVFDDLDAAPFTTKDEITNEFLKHLDGKNNKDLTGFFIATVNDPSKLHMTVINRPERFDDVIYVSNPKSHEEITTIFFDKAAERGYYPIDPTKVKDEKADPDSDEEDDYDDDDDDDDDGEYHWNQVGTIAFTKDSDELKEITAQILEANFTQVQVAGLVSDCHFYVEEDNKITLKLLHEAVDRRLESVNTANMVAKKGRLYVDKDHISEEASAALSKRRY